MLGGSTGVDSSGGGWMYDQGNRLGSGMPGSDIRGSETTGFDYLNPSKVDAPFTGSRVPASQAQESAILQNELKDYQFSDFAEGMRSDPGRLRTPFSGGPGVGESFPVTSPDFIPQEFGGEKVREIGASQYSAGKISALDARRHKEMQQSIGWQDRLGIGRR